MSELIDSKLGICTTLSPFECEWFGSNTNGKNIFFASLSYMTLSAVASPRAILVNAAPHSILSVNRSDKRITP